MKNSSVYSAFVSIMKIILPVTGALILIAVIAWPLITSKDFQPLTNVDKTSQAVVENHMLKPHYASTDKKGRSFEVDAEWGKPTSMEKEEADLITPHGKMETEKHGNVIVDSKHGHYYKLSNFLELDTEVVLETEDGYHFETEKADVDIKNNVLEGDMPIKGHGPTGELQAEDGFKLEETEDGNRILVLKGRSRVVINSDTLKKANKS